MPAITYGFYRINDDGTTTAIPAGCVTGGTIRDNRQNLTDPVTVSTGTLYGRLPSSMPTIAVGTGIRITRSGLVNDTTDLRVNNYTVHYGLVANADTWTMELEDVLADIGRASVTVSWSAGSTTQAAAQLVSNAVGISLDAITPDPSNSTVSAQSFTNENAMTIVRRLAQTEEGRVYSVGAVLSGSTTEWYWAFTDRDRAYTTVDGVFQDGTVGTPDYSMQIKYQVNNFAGIGDNYADTVTVEPAGLADQTAGTGYRNYSVQTYDSSTTQALNNAQYLAAELAETLPGPRSLSFLAEAQDSHPKTWGDVITIYFRGSTYYAAVIGTTETFTQDSTRFTLDLVPGGQVAWLKLNDNVLGRLDYNKLGF